MLRSNSSVVPRASPTAALSIASLDGPDLPAAVSETYRRNIDGDLDRGLNLATPAAGDTEVVHVFHATGLSDRGAASDENERIEIVRWPLDDLDGALAATRDAKTIIGLQWLKLDRG